MELQKTLKGPEYLDLPPSGAKTTAISTIGVQSGKTRVIIAVLVSKDWIELKICDMNPSLIDIGRSLDEAIDYQQQHLTALKKLETKQTPVEKLLGSADEILANKDTDPIVFSAMAENLALAWKNLTHQLQQRSKTLNQSVNFYRRCDQFNQWIEKAEAEFSVVILPETLEGVRKVLADIEGIKRNLLESSMFAMNEQQLLLHNLDEMAAANLYDSRPLYKSLDIGNVIAYVIDYLEQLQEKRRRLVTLFIQRKKLLDSQYLRLHYIELLNGIVSRMDQERSILEGINPGCSAREAGIARYKMDEIERSLKTLGTEALRLASEIDQHSEEMNSQVKDLAYGVLEEYSSLMFTLEEMKSLQSSFASFLETASLTSAKLDTMFDSLERPSHSNNQINRSKSPLPCITLDYIQETIKETVTSGYHLLDLVGTNQSYIQPINAKLHEIQEKCRALEDKLASIQPVLTAEMATETESSEIVEQQSTQQFEQKQQETTAVKNSEKLDKAINLKDDLSRWLNQKVCDFLRGHQDMGSSIGVVNDFLEKHQKLSIEMETKSLELKVLLSIIHRMETEGESIPEEVQNSLDELKANWELYSTLLENRILLTKRYSTFHKIASDVTRNLDQLENDLIKLDKITDEGLRPLTEIWVSLRQETVKLKNLEVNFTREIKQNKDPFLDKERGILCTQSILTYINNLMIKIESLMECKKNLIAEKKFKSSRAIQVSVQTDEIPIRKPVEVKNAETMVNNSVQRISTEEKITRMVYHDVTNIKSQRLIEIPDKPEALPDRAPMFIQNLTDITLDEKSVLFLSCAVVGHPSPKVTWYRDGQEVYCSRGQEVTEDMESKTYSLIIQEVSRSHQGVYTVQAVNSLGKASSSCHVTIKPKITDKRPQFLKYLEDRVVQSGDDVTLTCQITGQPEPKVTWYFNHRRIELDDLTRFSLNQNGEIYSLVIPSITDDLQGNYCIVAENTVGKAVSSGNIIIKDLHKSTSSQSLTGLPTNTANQLNIPLGVSTRANSEMRTTFREMTSSCRTFQTTTTSRSASQSAQSFIQQLSQPSSSSSTGSTIQLMPSPSPLSTRKSESITREEHHFRKVNDEAPEISHSFNQENLVTTDKGIESHEVKSFVERNNKLGSTISPSSDDNDIKPPHIVRHLVNQLVNPGEEITFEIELSGNPLPDVIWLRKGIPIDVNAENLIATNPTPGIYRLTFKEAWPEDSGLITVKASNSLGAIESNANLLVQESRRESISSGSAIRCVNEGASVKQKKDFFTRIAMEQAGSTYDFKMRSMSLDRKLSSEGPVRLFKSSGGSVYPFASDLKQADSFESLPCGYKYSTSSAKSDISEEPSYYSAQEDNSEFKPVWVPKGFSSSSTTLPRVSKWQPVRAPGQNREPSSFTKAMSIPRGDICPSLLSTTLSVGSLSQTSLQSLHSSQSTSYFGQDISDHPTSEGNPVRAPIFITGLKDKSIPEGSYISLECEVDGYPPPTIKWYHNDIEVASASGSQIDSLTGGICRLIIEKSTRPAAGKYVCRASNLAGSISTSCHLKILNQPNQ